MVFVPVKSYRAARRRYPRAAIICKVDGGYMCFASRADWLKWRAMR
jgi:hypothetical protein